MRLCLLSLPGPVPGLPASWGQIEALLFFQGVKEHYPPCAVFLCHTDDMVPAHVGLGKEAMKLEPRTAGFCTTAVLCDPGYVT